LKTPDRETSVYSTSAIDLFASALGAFILLVMLLFPYYRNEGTADAWNRTQDIMERKREAAAQTEDLEARAESLRSELTVATADNEQLEQRLAQQREAINELKDRLAALPEPSQEPVAIPDPEVSAPPLTDGVEFSILGLASESKSFVIVVDMSGSMLNYESLMLRSVLDLLEPLDASNRFAILGYQGTPETLLWRYPAGIGLLPGTPENLEAAREFTRSLARKFFGSTPTHAALLAALDYPASSVILMSDGEPNEPPGFIVQDISARNRARQTEIHTVAIGEYTHNRNLVLFMQALARLNHGDFVGVSR